MITFAPKRQGISSVDGFCDSQRLSPVVSLAAWCRVRDMKVPWRAEEQRSGRNAVLKYRIERSARSSLDCNPLNVSMVGKFHSRNNLHNYLLKL